MVIWIIGKSGSGKSFLAKNLIKKLKKKYKKTIWVDGDDFRKKYSQDLGYTLKDRKINSRRIQRHCKVFENKSYVVVCSILSVFREHQKKNRSLFTKYIQIYIDVSTQKLLKRNSKKIYTNKKNVIGKDLKFPIPYKSDIKIKNNFDQSYLRNLKKITKIINEKLS